MGWTAFKKQAGQGGTTAPDPEGHADKYEFKSTNIVLNC